MDRLLDFVLSVIQDLIPFVIVHPWEAGVITCGSWWREVGPGVVWKVPVLMQVWTVNVKRQTISTPEMAVRTRDGVELALKAVITYGVKHPAKVFIEVQDHDQSIVERAQVFLAEYVSTHPLIECTWERVQQEVGGKVRREGFRWGLEVEDFGTVELARARVFRLLGAPTVYAAG